MNAIGRGEAGGVGLADAVRVHDAFGQPGRTRAVDDVEEIVVGDVDPGRFVIGRRRNEIYVPEVAFSSRPVDQDESVGGNVESVAHGVDLGDQPVHGDHGERVGIVDEVHQPVATQERAEGDDDDSGLRDGLIDLEDFERVVEQDGDLVGAAQAEVA